MNLFMSEEGKNRMISVPDDTDFRKMIENDYMEQLLAAKAKCRGQIQCRTPQEILNVVCRPGDNAYRREKRHQFSIDPTAHPKEYQKVLQQAAEIQQRTEERRVEGAAESVLIQEYKEIIRTKLPPKQAEMMIALCVEQTETVDSWAAKHGIRRESVMRQLKRIRAGMKRSWFIS